MTRKLFPLVVALVGLSVVFSGCAWMKSTGPGAYSYEAGKLTWTAANTVADTHNAVLAAFNQLGIRVTQDQTSRLGGTIKGVTSETNEDVTVDLEPKGSDKTNLDVRVGIIGDRGKSEKIADAIRGNLKS